MRFASCSSHATAIELLSACHLLAMMASVELHETHVIHDGRRVLMQLTMRRRHHPRFPPASVKAFYSGRSVVVNLNMYPDAKRFLLK